jgi:hypothetical protein
MLRCIGGESKTSGWQVSAEVRIFLYDNKTKFFDSNSPVEPLGLTGRMDTKARCTLSQFLL